ncbi:MAG TPA: outer membrane lipoprotein carrier protein LolA [Cyclobacteriaceae bacterium]|nr:outer membrane lipoprotein carrier protein LolA [Cyclobacteriaceae bacterium]
MMLNKCLMLVLFGIGIQFGAKAQKDPKAEEILNSVSENYKSLNGLTAEFEYTYSNTPDAPVQTNKGKVTVKGDKYRLVLDDQEIYNNGETVWTYIKSDNFKEVTINTVEEDMEELTPSNIYNIYKKGYNYKYLGEETRNGRVVQIIELNAEDRRSQFQQITLFVDKARKYLVEWEIKDDIGGTFSYKFREIDAQANIPDSFFVFNTKEHPDVEVIDLR